MKRKGYTIAEVIITLAIIGVVAALTIPPFVTNYRKQSYATSLSKAVANFENAMTTTMMRDGVNDLFSTNAWKASAANFSNNLNFAIKSSSVSGSTKIISLKNGAVYRITTQNSDGNAKKELEVLNAGTNMTAKAGEVTIDINGDAKPNTIGRDQFKYLIGSDGILYPLYSKDWAVYTGKTYSEPKTECVNNKKLDYCGAYLQLNGYKMDY